MAGGNLTTTRWLSRGRALRNLVSAARLNDFPPSLVNSGRYYVRKGEPSECRSDVSRTHLEAANHP